MTSTQRKATAGTYRRIATMIRPGSRILDYGAGLGHGTFILGPLAESFEPNPQEGIWPTYTDASALPRFKYDAVVCNCVLNVVSSHAQRVSIIKHIGELLRNGGFAYIMVRSHSDVRAIKHATPEGDGVRTSTGSFQRGFSHAELEALVCEALPPNAVTVEKIKGISSIGIHLTAADNVII